MKTFQLKSHAIIGNRANHNIILMCKPRLRRMAVGIYKPRPLCCWTIWEYLHIQVG